MARHRLTVKVVSLTRLSAPLGRISRINCNAFRCDKSWLLLGAGISLAVSLLQWNERKSDAFDVEGEVHMLSHLWPQTQGKYSIFRPSAIHSIYACNYIFDSFAEKRIFQMEIVYRAYGYWGDFIQIVNYRYAPFLKWFTSSFECEHGAWGAVLLAAGLFSFLCSVRYSIWVTFVIWANRFLRLLVDFHLIKWSASGHKLRTSS